jgi:hypothetical protein
VSVEMLTALVSETIVAAIGAASSSAENAALLQPSVYIRAGQRAATHLRDCCVAARPMMACGAN